MDMVNEVAKRVVRRPRIDVTGLVVMLGGGRYTAVDMPSTVRDYLTVLGLKTALLSGDNVDTAYTLLMSGLIPNQRPPTPPRRSKWREAIAATLAQAMAAAAAPRGIKRAALDAMVADRLEGMRTHVATLSKDTVRHLAGREDVGETYRRMFSPHFDGQESLLALAGVVDGPLPLPDQGERAYE
jgi:hypothetical protein